MAAVKTPRRPKATTKKPRTYRDADWKTNIERYNESLKGEKIVHKTTTEWADIIKVREDARQARNRAEDALKIQIDRCIGYQKEIWELNRELWRGHTGSFFIGLGIAFFISYLYIHFC